MQNQLKEALEAVLKLKILQVKPLSGGSINTAYELHTERGKYFTKSNSAAQFPRLFSLEAKGLKLLSMSRTIRTPYIIGTADCHSFAFLLLEFIATKKTGNRVFWETFGTLLAQLHRTSNPKFGLDCDNYIGSLSQSNKEHAKFVHFFREERLRPLVKLARSNNYFNLVEERAFEVLYKKLPSLIPEERPALIHGDLWSGNFLIDANNQPVLIDPAVCFAHREMDLAMSTLFGGFHTIFYEAYQNAFPTAPNLSERLEVYQLYYLLVHVNLFGESYVSSVRNILNKYC